jgi:hypothetical protein
MPVRTVFAWEAITDEQFEDLVFEIVLAAGPLNAKWRKGPGDKGRDVEATFAERDAFGASRHARYAFEAKHHRDGVSPTDIAGALAWAAAEAPHTLVIVVSSHLTTPCREHVQAWAQTNPRVRTSVWERREVEDKVLASQSARAVGIKMGLLPPSLAELLPPDPTRLRSSPVVHGLEMQYRLLLTLEEADRLDGVIDTMEELAQTLNKQSKSYRYFDLTALAAGNCLNFLRILQAQVRLEVATREYLTAQASGASVALLASLAEHVQQATNNVRAIGDRTVHVD